MTVAMPHSILDGFSVKSLWICCTLVPFSEVKSQFNHCKLYFITRVASHMCGNIDYLFNKRYFKYFNFAVSLKSDDLLNYRNITLWGKSCVWCSLTCSGYLTLLWRMRIAAFHIPWFYLMDSRQLLAKNKQIWPLFQL